MHAVAEFLPENARRAMVLPEYRRVWKHRGPEGLYEERHRLPVTRDGCCPMGVAMRAAGLDRDAQVVSPFDAYLSFRDADLIPVLRIDGTEDENWYAAKLDEVGGAFTAFCAAWDSGEIAPDELGDALGVSA